MISVKQFTFNHFMENCYLLADEAKKQCAIVDPGMSTASEAQVLASYIEANKLEPVLLLLTHAHVDHLAGLRQVSKRYSLPVTLHEDGMQLLKEAQQYGTYMGFEGLLPMDDLKTSFVQDGDILKMCDNEIEVRHTPGHCVGSVCYVLHAEKIVLTGDALFCGSIGRTDLPGGNLDVLLEHLHKRILTLPDDYDILPGHGEASTIGIEKRSNPFL